MSHFQLGGCVCVFQTESERPRWKPAVVVVTDKDLMLYDSMTRMKENWHNPAHTYPLLSTRYCTHTHTHTYSHTPYARYRNACRHNSCTHQLVQKQQAPQDLDKLRFCSPHTISISHTLAHNLSSHSDSLMNYNLCAS